MQDVFLGVNYVLEFLYAIFKMSIIEIVYPIVLKSECPDYFLTLKNTFENHIKVQNPKMSFCIFYLQSVFF